MPYLDVSEILSDPMIADTFDVGRRSEVVNGYGESTITTATTKGVVGVVTMASPNDLERLPEDQRMGKHISIVTAFRLQGPSPGFQPDSISWHGDTYVVKAVDDYSGFGSGFVQVIAGSMDSIDQPPQEAPT